MEENKELLELLKQLNSETKKQARYLKLQCVFALISALCFVGIFLLVYDFLPQIATLVQQLKQIMTQLPEMLLQMDVVLDNLEIVTTELAAVDFASMIENVNLLVQTGQTSLLDTVEKLNTIDFEALNKAIENLAAVIEPLANFVNRFK